VLNENVYKELVASLPQMVQEMKQKVYGAGPDGVGGL